ncbi:ECs_2282 family putative zinc-binding protein [Serratia marcescens]
MAVKITCPKCDGEICVTSIEIHFMDELKYTTCASCGNIIREEEIIAQAQEQAITAIAQKQFNA